MVMAMNVCALMAQASVDVSVQQLLASGLRLVQIEAQNDEWPTCDYVTHPEGAMGESITNATRVPARIIISDANDVCYDSGPYVEKKSGMLFKIHGNTSAYLTRKSYKVKLSREADLLHRHDDSKYADKHWLLMAEGPWMDMMTGFQLSRMMGMEWTPALEYVNLIINGQFMGVYALVEQVRRNVHCRIDVDKRTGYIIERDPYWWNEPLYFTSPMNKEYTFKYPDEDDVTPSQMQYISSCVQQMEQSIVEGNYEQYIDIRSFAKWLLTHDILGTWDSGGSNIFIAKYDDTDETLMRMPCIWDLGSMLRMKDAWARIHTDKFFYFPMLLESNNTAFIQTYLDEWERADAEVMDAMQYFIDSLYASPLAQAIGTMKGIEEKYFKYTGSTLEEDARMLKEWFYTRRLWLRKEMEKIHTNVSQIESPSQDANRERMIRIYSCSGQLIWSGYSSGRSFSWDGCNLRGQRVSSGVYHVVSSTADGGKAVVTRITVIK